MKIKIINFRGISNADIETGPITIISGPNAAGKTSIMQGIQAGTTPNSIPVDDITKSLAYMLIKGGSQSGSIEIDNAVGRTSVEYPSTNRQTEGEPLEISTTAAGLESLVTTPKKQRADVIRVMLKSDPTREELAKEIGVTPEQIQKIWQTIEAQGWDAAHDHAKKTGSTLKGQWEGTTGENYGAQKAASWLPASWESDLHTAQEAELRKQVTIENEILEVSISECAVSDSERQRLETESKKLESAKLKETELHDELDGLFTTRDTIRRAIDKLPLAKQPDTCNCPHCNKPVQIVGNTLAMPAVLSDAELADRKKAIEDSEKSYQDTLKQINIVNADYVSAQAARKTAEKAGQDLAKLSARKGGSTPEAVEECRKKLKHAQDRLDAFVKKAGADKIHKQIVNNQKIVDILAPDGIRQKKIKDALGSLNAMLKNLCTTASWETVLVSADMAITYGGRPYMLLSKSEQYRVRIVLQYATAITDTSTVVLIDEADMLDPAGKKGLFTLAATVQRDDQISSVIALTAPRPDVLPAIGKRYWVESGEVRAL